jgi:uncharacterized protein DUF4236
MAPYAPVRSLWPATAFFVPAGYRLPRGKALIDGTQQRNQKPMGFRFRKRIRLAKGLGINLSKKGGSQLAPSMFQTVQDARPLMKFLRQEL